MKISLNWIKNYINGIENISIDSLIKSMVSIGLDIESVELKEEKYKNFVVGEVVETAKHPDADKLTICKVDIAEGEPLRIVCGAQNVKPEQKVCVALIGAVIPNGGFEIKKSKIRGELSEGMICAEDELGLSDDHSGIMILKDSAVIGTKFSDYIGANDVLIEIGITPNRGDLFSHIGIAREIAFIFNKKIVLPEINIKESKEKSSDYASIEIQSREYCKRFTGRVIKNVKITDSPEWLKKRILSIGLRPRNNIVDITNFVMFETGQPLHSFDYEKIRKKGIVVKTANEGDKFTTLDGKERILNSKSLMVCDKEGYSAIAGIMGGEFSEITEDTKNIFLESAYFDPVCVRKNSKNLGLQTDASQRFERGVDIDIVEYASNRASSLIQEIAGGEVLEGLIDVYPEKFEKLFVGITAEKTSKILGKKFTKEKIKELLEKIEIIFVKEENSELIFEIPEFRRYDLTREIDLIEEVARLYGYDNLESDFRFCIDTTSHRDYEDEFRKFVKNIRSYFIGRGFNEIITYSQQDKNKVEQFSENYVSIENPNSVEMNTMRINLEYGMLDVIKKNFNFSGTGIPLRLFEIGKVFLERDEKFSEKNILSFAISGKFDFLSFNSEERVFDFFDLKGETDMLMSKLNLENCKYIYYNEQNKLCFVLNNEEFGVIKQVNKSHNDLFELENDVYIAEFDLNILFKNSGLNKFFNKISKFPSVKRDLAIVVNDDVKYNDLEEHIKESAGKLLNSVSLFDIYTGEKIGRGKKSMTFTLEFLSGEKTLTDNEINITVNKILKSLNKKLSAELRT